MRGASDEGLPLALRRVLRPESRTGPTLALRSVIGLAVLPCQLSMRRCWFLFSWLYLWFCPNNAAFRLLSECKIGACTCNVSRPTGWPQRRP